MRPYEKPFDETAPGTGVALTKAPQELTAAQLMQIGYDVTEVGLYAVALASFLRAARLERRADTLAEVANAYRLCWRFEEALATIDDALGDACTDGRVYANYGLILLDVGRPEHAVLNFDRAIELGLTNPKLLFARSWALFACGRFRDAFVAYDARFRVNGFGPHSCPIWKGEPLGGKTLLVEGEQGYGDTIMFARFVHEVPGNVVLSLPPALMGLYPGSKRLGEEIRADYWCPIMSLPGRLGLTDLNHAPVLRPPRHMQLATDTLLNIGIWWESKAGGGKSPGETIHGRQKSCPMDLFVTELATLPGVRLHCLQTDVDVKDAAGLIVKPLIYDFADQASYMAQMDLCVGIDSAPLHLAGAMRRPTIALLNWVGGWPWGGRNMTTPWYPSMQLARHPTP